MQRGNSSRSCIPSARQAISGAAAGGTKQELIRGAVKTKNVNLAPKLSDGPESEAEVRHGDPQLGGNCSTNTRKRR